MWTRKCAVVGVFGALGLMQVLGCFPPPTDDDEEEVVATPTPEEASPTEGPTAAPTPVPPKVTMSGTVTAVDRATGATLDAATYAQRAGLIVVYALTDPADLAHPIGKAVMTAPGYYTMDVPENSGKVFVAAVADYDFNHVITDYDVMREALVSPVTVAAAPMDGVDIVIDLAPHGGGGGPDPGDSDFSGDVIYDADVDTNIAVVAFRGEYGGTDWGMVTRQNEGAYSLRVKRWGSTTALVGYADADHNGVYEPSDPAGLPESNPYPLDDDARSGVDILIEGIGKVPLPQPIPYVSVAGTVSVDASYTSTAIYLSLSGADGSIKYASSWLQAPGNFSLRVPGNLSDLTLTAITDTSADGSLDPTQDANASYGPFDLGASSLGGISLELVSPLGPVTGVSGEVDYAGTPLPGQQLVIGVFMTDDTLGGVVTPVAVLPASFPAEYQITGLETVLTNLGLNSGTFYVAAALDVDGTWNGGPEAADITGGYASDSDTLKGITIQLGEIVPSIDFDLGNWAPTVL